MASLVSAVQVCACLPQRGAPGGASLPGVCTVNSRPFGWFLRWQCPVALAVAALAAGAEGCGPSTVPSRPDAGGATAKKLKDEDLYTKGTGTANKKSEPVSRRDRVKMLHDAAKNSD